jgi:pimeloyl-ACP methyl ester carboxylesterase
MANYVLVHGAWHGGWCWKRVAELLAAKHHTVLAPTLTGLCERSHLLSPDIDLDTHVLDIVNEIKWKELRDVILVGHS